MTQELWLIVLTEEKLLATKSHRCLSADIDKIGFFCPFGCWHGSVGVTYIHIKFHLGTLASCVCPWYIFLSLWGFLDPWSFSLSVSVCIYAHHGAPSHDPEVKSHAPLAEPGRHPWIFSLIFIILVFIMNLRWSVYLIIVSLDFSRSW